MSAPTLEHHIEVAFELYVKDFDGVCLDEEEQIYKIGNRKDVKGNLMKDQQFEGYSSALVGYPTPEKYHEGLMRERPKLGIFRGNEVRAEKHSIKGQEENRNMNDYLYNVMTEKFRVGWEKGLLRKDDYSRTIDQNQKPTPHLRLLH
ncbi:MAG: hypothetical protein NT001_04295 [Candidatus Woesearchaeota archaeon]|nr:hypothetical protein [Candidatus Woesearchaeota archaeon]